MQTKPYPNFQADDDPGAEWTISTNLDGEQGIEGQIFESSNHQIFKLIKNGLLFIERNGKIYNVQGVEVK